MKLMKIVCKLYLLFASYNLSAQTFNIEIDPMSSINYSNNSQSIVADRFDNIYTVGNHSNGNMIIKYSPSGSIIMSKIFENSKKLTPKSIIIDENDKIIIYGTVNEPLNGVSGSLKYSMYPYVLIMDINFNAYQFYYLRSDFIEYTFNPVTPSNTISFEAIQSTYSNINGNQVYYFLNSIYDPMFNRNYTEVIEIDDISKLGTSSSFFEYVTFDRENPNFMNTYPDGIYFSKNTGKVLVNGRANLSNNNYLYMFEIAGSGVYSDLYCYQGMTFYKSAPICDFQNMYSIAYMTSHVLTTCNSYGEEAIGHILIDNINPNIINHQVTLMPDCGYHMQHHIDQIDLNGNVYIGFSDIGSYIGGPTRHYSSILQYNGGNYDFKKIRKFSISGSYDIANNFNSIASDNSGNILFDYHRFNNSRSVCKINPSFQTNCAEIENVIERPTNLNYYQFQLIWTYSANSASHIINKIDTVVNATACNFNLQRNSEFKKILNVDTNSDNLQIYPTIINNSTFYIKNINSDSYDISVYDKVGSNIDFKYSREAGNIKVKLVNNNITGLIIVKVNDKIFKAIVN